MAKRRIVVRTRAAETTRKRSPTFGSNGCANAPGEVIGAGAVCVGLSLGFNGANVPRKHRSKSRRSGCASQEAAKPVVEGNASLLVSGGAQVERMPLEGDTPATDVAPKTKQEVVPNGTHSEAATAKRKRGTLGSGTNTVNAGATPISSAKPKAFQRSNSKRDQHAGSNGVKMEAAVDVGDAEFSFTAQAGLHKRQLRPPKAAVGVAAQQVKSTHLPTSKLTGVNAPKRNSQLPEDLSDDADPQEPEVLLGCPECSFNVAGCDYCIHDPLYMRPKLRWKPELGRYQEGIEDAPTFYPTAEEFKDPFAYISKVRPEAEKFGLCCIVPPDDFKPLFALEKGSNGVNAETFKFHIRKQPTSLLCVREAVHDSNPEARPGVPKGPVKYGRVRRTGDKHCSMPSKDFGFVYLDEQMTYKEFATITDWVKQQHFKSPQPQGVEPPPKRYKVYHYKGPTPSVEEVEAEFWRIVEDPEELVESLYGQDVDSGHMGSGFPLPHYRLQMLEERLASQAGTSTSGSGVFKKPRDSAEDKKYRYHKWNINNLPRAAGSVLRHVVNDELITGVMVPWLYIGSCLSAFCWHVEDHGFYSINYMHHGAAKVWYGVPGHAAQALEDAIKDALPHLVEAQPNLLYQLVTMLSPKELKARGVPVYRMVHREGSFVITMPNAYHGGFNTGFNCAEAVNFAPADWIPWGTELAEKYRRDAKALTLSFDALLVTLVKAAEKHEPAWKQARVAAGLRPRKRPETSNVTEEPDIQEESLDSVPLEAIRLAAGELTLRIKEEKRRREAGLADGPLIEIQRMRGPKHGRHPRGFFLNTEDTDCDHCKCDLYLSAVVSPQAPNQAVCPEHADKLQCDPETMVLLYRHTMDELAGMVAMAIENVEGTEEAIREATIRKDKLKAMAVEIKRLGPLSRDSSKPKMKPTHTKAHATQSGQVSKDVVDARDDADMTPENGMDEDMAVETDQQPPAPAVPQRRIRVRGFSSAPQSAEKASIESVEESPPAIDSMPSDQQGHVQPDEADNGIANTTEQLTKQEEGDAGGDGQALVLRKKKRFRRSHLSIVKRRGRKGERRTAGVVKRRASLASFAVPATDAPQETTNDMHTEPENGAIAEAVPEPSSRPETANGLDTEPANGTTQEANATIAEAVPEPSPILDTANGLHTEPADATTQEAVPEAPMPETTNGLHTDPASPATQEGVPEVSPRPETTDGLHTEPVNATTRDAAVPEAANTATQEAVSEVSRPETANDMHTEPADATTQDAAVPEAPRPETASGLHTEAANPTTQEAAVPEPSPTPKTANGLRTEPTDATTPNSAPKPSPMPETANAVHAAQTNTTTQYAVPKESPVPQPIQVESPSPAPAPAVLPRKIIVPLGLPPLPPPKVSLAPATEQNPSSGPSATAQRTATTLPPEQAQPPPTNPDPSSTGVSSPVPVFPTGPNTAANDGKDAAAALISPAAVPVGQLVGASSRENGTAVLNGTPVGPPQAPASPRSTGSTEKQAVNTAAPAAAPIGEVKPVKMSEKLAEWLKKPAGTQPIAVPPATDKAPAPALVSGGLVATPEAALPAEAVIGPRLPDGLEILKLLACQGRTDGTERSKFDWSTGVTQATSGAKGSTDASSASDVSTAEPMARPMATPQAPPQGDECTTHETTSPLPGMTTSPAMSPMAGAAAAAAHGSSQSKHSIHHVQDGASPGGIKGGYAVVEQPLMEHVQASHVVSGSVNFVSLLNSPHEDLVHHSAGGGAVQQCSDSSLNSMEVDPMPLDKLAELLEEQGVPEPVTSCLAAQPT